jgi:hypothetical protein
MKLNIAIFDYRSALFLATALETRKFKLMHAVKPNCLGSYANG